MDVRGQMRRAASFFRDREAIVVRDRRLTFGEAWRRGVKTANLFLSLGLEPGDHIGTLEDNSIEAVDHMLGACIANLVRVPLYPRNATESHQHMLRHTGCKAVVVAEKYRDELGDVRAAIPSLRHILVTDAAYETELQNQSDVDPDPVIRPEDLYIIRHTGGTSGLPRGVAYSHWKWLASGRDWFFAWPPIRIGDACLHVASIAHGSGYLFVPVWLSGGRNVLLPEFNVEEALDTIEREHIGYSFLVSTMLNSMVASPTVRNRDYSSLKVLNVGAAPIADETALQANEIFGPVVYQAYGQTEALPATMSPPEDWIVRRTDGRSPIRSAGRPLPFAEIEIRDIDTGARLPVGAEGEIAVRTDAQMEGYWGGENPEKISDGWVLTGDVGLLDEDGFLYIMDRKDDLIISGGFNIWPAELENVIQSHPDIEEVAVIRIPHERWGEAPAAICFVKPSASVTEAEITELCARQLGSYKKPALVVLRNEPLPKSPVGKVQRKILSTPFWVGSERRVAGR